MVVTDNSQKLIIVQHEISADQTLPISMKVHDRILIASARYKTLDSMLGIPVVLSLQNFTDIVVLTSELANLSAVSVWSYAQPSLQRLNEMMSGSRRQGRMEESVVVELMDRANEILMEVQLRS